MTTSFIDNATALPWRNFLTPEFGLIWTLQMISVLAELLKLLIPALKIFREEAAPLGLDVN